jgi:hypothetical protein
VYVATFEKKEGLGPSRLIGQSQYILWMFGQANASFVILKKAPLTKAKQDAVPGLGRAKSFSPSFSSPQVVS